MPSSLGGDNNDTSAFRAYSMVDLRLHCLARYWSDEGWWRIEDPCHGTFYDPLNGIAINGVGKDFNFRGNALPRLDLEIDKDGYLYIKPPVWDVNANGIPGFGRKVS